MFAKYVIVIFLLLLSIKNGISQSYNVKVAGKMSKIGKENRVDADILVDTINYTNLYALGPVENLRGEMIIWDNKRYIAALTDDKKPMVQKNTKNLKAIFLAYANVSKWDTLVIKDNIGSLQKLQILISKKASEKGMDTTKAFPFLMYARVAYGKGHIMFKDTTEKVLNAAVLKAAKNINSFEGIDARMLGFYSQNHQTVFTPQGSFIHIHYLLSNKYQAGHLDEIIFDPQTPIRLLIPKL